MNSNNDFNNNSNNSNNNQQQPNNTPNPFLPQVVPEGSFEEVKEPLTSDSGIKNTLNQAHQERTDRSNVSIWFSLILV